MTKAIVIPELLDTLPFYDVLTWERFQALCTDLLYKLFKSVDSREYLVKGSKQQGIDAYSVRKGEEKITVAQCKLREYVSPQQVMEIIQDFLDGNLVEETKEFILCTSADLGRQKDEEETIAKARKKLGAHGIELVVWDQRGLSMELRTKASADILHIVYRYFGEPVALSFYGQVWTNHIKKLRTVKKHFYEIPLDHIERHITSYVEQLSTKETENFYIWNKKIKPTLISLIEENPNKNNKKIVLISTAGFGKTEELNNLAGHFSAEEKILYPIKFNLRNYEAQSIENLLLSFDPDWRNIEPENILLIFDGLDEVSENHLQTFINHLNAFVEQNPKTHVVVSSRYNFYDVKHSQLNNFEIYLLDPLTIYDIQYYLENKLGRQKEEFENLLRERNFYEYMNNPYYLARLVRFYKEKISFPKNKTDLFNRILFERLEKDEGRYNIPELKEKLLPVARKIAFCMTVSSKSSLTDEEMKIIVMDQETKKSLNHFGIINRNATSLGSWSFEHKNLQEYLCGSVFSTSSLGDIQNIVAFKLNSNKLLPRFLNTITFLFELIDKNSMLFKELFTWINANEPEILVRFEKEQLSKETRMKILEHIFHNYKKQHLTMRASTNFSYDDIARFVEIDEEVISFVYNEVNSGLPHPLLYDALAILDHCKRSYLYRSQLTKLLLCILNTKDYPEYIYAKVINSFSSLGFTGKEVFQEILNSGINLMDYDIRNACLFFLNYTNYYENYSPFILDSVAILEEGHRQKNRSSSFTTLKQLLLKFDTPSKLKEILQHCISDKNSIQRHYRHREFHFELDEVKMLLKKAADSSKKEKSILPLVYRLYCQTEYVSADEEWFSAFKLFFERTCGTRIIFKKFYRYDKRQRDIMSFADEWCCDFLIEQYQNGNITDQEMTVFRNVLSHTNTQLFFYFYDKLKPLNNGYFVIEDITVDYNALRVQQEEKNQQMLLDQDLFFEEAEVVFSAVAKEDVSLKDLWYSENKELRKYQWSVVLQAIRDLCIHDDDKIITKEEFLDKYQQPDKWEGFVIDTAFNLMKDEKKTLRPELQQVLKKWCIKKIETLDFKKSIVDQGNSFQYVPIIEFVKDVFLLLDIDIPDELLLKMLSSDYESFYGWNEESKETLSPVIILKVKDRDLLQKTVIDNIKNGELAVLVLCTHYAICHHLEYKECLGHLYQSIIFHPLLTDQNRIKLTDYYVDLGGEITDFTSQLKIPDVETENSAYTSWQWYLLEKLLFIEKEKVTEILLGILESQRPTANKLRAAEHLIELSRIEGLEYWASYVKTTRQLPFEHRWPKFQRSLENVPTESAIEIFLSVLEFSYQNNLQDNFSGHYFMEESMYSSLITLSKKDYRYYTIIKSRIADLTAKFSSAPFVDSIKFYSERLTQRFYENQNQEIDIQTSALMFENFNDTFQLQPENKK